MVTDLIDKEYDDKAQETSEMKSEEFALKTNVFLLQADQRPKQNHEDVLLFAHLQELHLSVKYLGLMLSQEFYSHLAYPVSKRLSTLLRHAHLLREGDGAIECWRLKDCLRYEFENSQHWSDEMWKSRVAGGGGHNKRFQYCTDSSGQEILYLRALHGQSGRNPIDLSLQDNVLIPDNFFEYIITSDLHSIMNSGLIPGGQILGKERQTVFFYGCEFYEQGRQRSV